MPSEAWSSNPTPPHKSLESLKETFKQRLDAILHKQLTVENIDTFAEEALSETVKLTEDVLKEYRSNPNVYPNQIPLDKQVQENEAFAILDLPNISEILQLIIDVKSKIDAIKTYLSEPKNAENKVIIPPQHDSPVEIKEGSGQGIKEKKFVPRLLTLLYILETDFDIKKEQVQIIEGKVTPEMIRKAPYVHVEIPDMKRIIYICNEEGNASYVFDTEKLEEAGIFTENLDVEDKGDMNELIIKHLGIGARIIQTKHWRTNMAELLGNPIPEKYQTKEKSKQPVSEFEKREKKEFLPFEEFQVEVKNLYPGKIEVSTWYRKGRQNHPNWPSNPNDFYKDKGWVSWPELVGRENFNRKEFLLFENFQAEVKALYQNEKDVHKYYNKERKNHPNWPANPERHYKNIGWIDWSELVGIKNYKKTEYPSLLDFQAEVKLLYPGKGDAHAWYNKERKNHPNWPANVEMTYKENWKGWPGLVGRESLIKKNFLFFENFQSEVKSLYLGGDIYRWYVEEKKKHSNWPFHPERTYQNKGWTSWIELVGKNK